jgi:hypothetical protein
MLRFIDGADHYDTAKLTTKWNNAVGVTVLAAAGRFGGNAIRINDVGAGGLLLKTINAQPTWIVGFALYTGTFPTTNTIILKVLDAGAVQVDLRLYSDGTLAVTRNGAALSGGQSTFALSTNTWHYVEFKVTIANAIGASTCQVKVDNAQVLDVAAGQDTQDTANSTANSISFHGSVPNATFDDIYICDAAGGVCTDFIGDSRIVTLLPNAAGDLTQWTVVNAGNNWSAQANNPSLNDGQYVYSATPGQVDLYNLQDPSLTGPIKGIQASVYSRKDDSGIRQIATDIKTGGVEFVGTTRNLTTSYVYYSSIYELNPDTVLAWTPANLIALQAGIKLVA